MNIDVNVVRPRMVSVAYRILGNVSDSEDAVQDAFLRLHTAGDVTSPEGYLFKTTTRCCIDKLRADRRRKRQCLRLTFDPVDHATVSPQATSEDSIQSALQLLSERLTAIERVAFLLRKVLLLEYSKLACILGKSEVNVRQIVSRAALRLSQGKRPQGSNRLKAERSAMHSVTECGIDGQLLIERLFNWDGELPT